MLLAKTTEPAASRIPSAAEFTLGRRLRKAGRDDAGAGHTRPHAPRNRVPAGNVESLRLRPNADPLNAPLAVTSRAPLSTRSLSAEMYGPMRVTRFPPVRICISLYKFQMDV
jgi:hypothetical protein